MSKEYFEELLSKSLKKSIREALSDPKARGEAIIFMSKEVKRLKLDPKRIEELIDDLSASILFSLATDVVVYAIMNVYGEEATIRKALADAVSNAVTGRALERFLKECNISYAISRFGGNEVEAIAQKVTMDTLAGDEEFLSLTEELKKMIIEALSKV
ncbi:MAG: hypothetical protein QXQ29_06105 [Candidatus Bathyarchaeia archaeon]